MMSYYVPWSDRFMSIFPNTDAKGEKTNTGDGQQMGMWIGAKMEDGPHAPRTRAHHWAAAEMDVLAGGHQRRALHERGRGRPALPEPAVAPAEEDRVADLRQQVERPDQVHGHRPRQRELVRGIGLRRAERLVRQERLHLRRGQRGRQHARLHELLRGRQSRGRDGELHRRAGEAHGSGRSRAHRHHRALQRAGRRRQRRGLRQARRPPVPHRGGPVLRLPAHRHGDPREHGRPANRRGLQRA